MDKVIQQLINSYRLKALLAGSITEIAFWHDQIVLLTCVKRVLFHDAFST